MALQSYNDPAKNRWREAWFEFLDKHKHHLIGPPKDWQVVFFPGPEVLELEVYDRLGIPRENVLGLENHAPSFETLQKRNLGIRLTDEPVDAVDFFRGTDEVFDIVNLDYTGVFSEDVAKTLEFIAGRQLLQEESIFGINVCGRRDGRSRKFYASGYFGANLKELTEDKLEANSRRISTEFYDKISKKIEGAELGELKDIGISSLIRTIFEKGISINIINPIIQRNPAFPQIDEILVKGFEDMLKPPTRIELHNESRVYSLHMELLCDYLIDEGIVPETAFTLARAIIMYYDNPFLPIDNIRYKYISQNRSPMFSDFIHFSQARNLIEPFQYAALNTYGSLELVELLQSFLKKDIKSKHDLKRANNNFLKGLRVFQDIFTRSSELEPRIHLGSSATLPKLTGELYFKERVKDAEQGIPIEETHDRLLEEYRTSPRSLPRFEAHVTMETYGVLPSPKLVESQNGNEGNSLESKTELTYQRLIPFGPWCKLSENQRLRVQYFLEEDLQRVEKSHEEKLKYLEKLKESEWYKDSNIIKDDFSFYTYFDDLLLGFFKDNKTDDISKLVEGSTTPYEQRPLIKDAHEYQALLNQGLTVEEIEEQYRGKNENSFRAFRAWVTMRQAKEEYLKQTDDAEEDRMNFGIGPDVIIMRRAGFTEDEVIDHFGIGKEEYKKYLEKNKKGDYNGLIPPLATSLKVHIDDRGVVSTSGENPRATEKKGRYR